LGIKRAIYLIVVVFLFSCYSKQQPLPEASLRAMDLNQRAEVAFKRGDFKRALSLYNGALKINRSIENTDSIALNIFNISAVYRKMGDLKSADNALDEILNPSGVFSERWLGEASFLRALIRLDMGLTDDALEWVEHSISYCGRCDSLGRNYNLKARILLKKALPEEALRYAKDALKLNKESENPEEYANSLRLVAEANLLSGQYQSALNLYEEALRADKSLALSEKVFYDLIGAGDSLFSMGKPKEAMRYYQRALGVAEAIGETSLIDMANFRIKKCDER